MVGRLVFLRLWWKIENLTAGSHSLWPGRTTSDPASGRRWRGEWCPEVRLSHVPGLAFLQLTTSIDYGLATS